MPGTVLGAGAGVVNETKKPASSRGLWLALPGIRPGRLLQITKINHGYSLSGAREQDAGVALCPGWLLGES